MTEHVGKRWARYGHDLLYVETLDGTRLGYWNVKTGQAVVEGEAHRQAVETAAAAFGGTSGTPVAVPAQAAALLPALRIPDLVLPGGARGVRPNGCSAAQESRERNRLGPRVGNR